MDNKQDRQFYWEVKDFMNKKSHELAPKAPKPPSLVEGVKDVLKRNELYRPSTFNPNVNSVNSIRQAISAMDYSRTSGKPNSVAYTKNLHSNPFGLIKEAIDSRALNVMSLAAMGQVPGQGSPDTSGQTGAQQDPNKAAADAMRKRAESLSGGGSQPTQQPEQQRQGTQQQSQPNIDAEKMRNGGAYNQSAGAGAPSSGGRAPRSEAERRRMEYQQQLASSYEESQERRKQVSERNKQDKFYGSKKYWMAAAKDPDSGLDQVAIDKAFEDAGGDPEKALTTIGAENREKMSSYQKKKNIEKTGDDAAKTFAELGGRDYGSLSDKEKGRLAFAHSMVSGDEQRQKDVRERAQSYLHGTREEAENFDRAMKDTGFTDRFNRELADRQKKEQQQKLASQRISPAYNMTYADFESDYGRPYDPRNKAHRDYVINSRERQKLDPETQALMKDTFKKFM